MPAAVPKVIASMAPSSFGPDFSIQRNHAIAPGSGKSPSRTHTSKVGTCGRYRMCYFGNEMKDESPVYLRQVQVGPMENFVYLLGDKEKGDCVMVDPAWEVDKLIDLAESEGM